MQKRFLLIPAIWIILFFFWSIPAIAEMIVDTAWVRRYNGPGNGEDHASAIAVDDLGNVYVTGYCRGDGTVWDYATIKYLSNGDTAWVRLYNGPSGLDDVAYAIALDELDNVFVTGRSYDTSTYDDYATVKYDSFGAVQWIRRYNGTANGYDRAYSMVIDSHGNTVVTGSSPGIGTGTDYATIKYDPDGTELWTKRYDGPNHYEYAAIALAIDNYDNVYVTGSSSDIGTDYDYATLKYYPNGDTAWVRTYNEPMNGFDIVRAIALDGSGNVYVTGSITSETGYDYATIKYYSNGDTAWVRKYDGPGESNEFARAIAVDNSSNVYVTGESVHAPGGYENYEFLTIGYDTYGNELWVRTYNDLENHFDGGSDITTDALGNVYVTGRSDDSTSVANYTTIKYNSSGDQLWVKRYDGGGYDWPSVIVVDKSDNVYITGYSGGSETGHDYATIKYFQALRGDVNKDGVIDIADVVYLINYLYKDGIPPNHLVIGDCNCDENVDIGDVVFLINYLFKSAPTPDC